MSSKVRLAVVGTGYWGINLVRTFAQLPSVDLCALVDSDAGALDRATRFAPSAKKYSTLDQVLAEPSIDAVVLATPAVLHSAQAQAALLAQKHVFVEKPLALSPDEAEKVAQAQRQSGRQLMVGHLMIYHAGYERLRQLCQSGHLGEVYYLYALRVNLGRLRKDENALWSLAPHDLSMILDLTGELPATVAARGECYLQPGIEDVVFVNLGFADKKMAQVQLSWLDPRKERRLTVVGSQKMVDFDDSQPSEKLRIYDKGYDRPPSFTQYGEYLTLRQGDVHIPRLSLSEPLEVECRHFIDCVVKGTIPRTSVDEGVKVVRVLDAAEQSLKRGGVPVKL